MMDVEEEIDRLYAAPPADFVARRDALVRELRADDREAAERVAALRRPTVAAWAVNRLSREAASDLGDLLEAGTQLRRAQRRALSGQRDRGLREATERRRAAVDRLTEQAVALLADAGRSGDAHRSGIAATLEAASVDPDSAEAVRRGRLERELAPPSGFEAMAGLPVPEAAAAEATAGTEPPAAEAELASAREAAQAADHAAADAERAAQQSRREADEARRDADRTQRQAAVAERTADAAERAAERAEETARTARDEAARRRRALEELEATASAGGHADGDRWV